MPLVSLQPGEMQRDVEGVREGTSLHLRTGTWLAVTDAEAKKLWDKIGRKLLIQPAPAPARAPAPAPAKAPTEQPAPKKKPNASGQPG